MKINPLYLSENGEILESQPGDSLDIPVISDDTEYVTLLVAANPNSCCAIVDETATPINSVNLPHMNYRTQPFIDCVILESGGPGDKVKAAVTNGKVYTTPLSIHYSSNDIVYLGQDSKLTTTPPSLLNGDKWQVIVGRLVNLNSFIFNPQTPIDLTTVNPGGVLPSPVGHGGEALFSDGLIALFRKIKQSDIKPTFIITSITLLEVGEHLINPNFTFTCNDIIGSLEIMDNYNNIPLPIDPPDSPYSYIIDYTSVTIGAILFTLTAHDSSGSPASDTASVSWLIKRYYGKSIKYTSGPLDTFITNLDQSDLSSNKESTFSTNPGNGENIYFAIPVSFGIPVFLFGSLVGGFHLLNTINITNNYGITISYNIYESDNSNLGLITVVVE